MTTVIDTRDAERFAAVFARSGGKPDAASLQRDYLNGAGRGVEVFMPGRIENAANLATAIAADRERYAYAIKTCLPLVASLDGELRATYLAYRGLLPDRQLPEVYVVFGAANSGGTAKPDAQVIGLESMCGPGTTPEQFRTGMRNIFAHEVAHTFQPDVLESATHDKLMFMALSEGTPDFLASLVTANPPSAVREEYGRANETKLWAQFQRDRSVLLGKSWAEIDTDPVLKAAMHRWFGNAGAAPEGVPSEMGYWVGMQIAAASFQAAPDKRAAINALLARTDPIALANASGYDGKVVVDPRQ
ncbi:hypothetical protein [Sphingorhabdus arenilitoris]|uniref:hypothetical protein n=1 Tax=Sphingorhabdus arenilitoris TaxID=1490041 RepID=UPI0036D3D982